MSLGYQSAQRLECGYNFPEMSFPLDLLSDIQLLLAVSKVGKATSGHINSGFVALQCYSLMSWRLSSKLSTLHGSWDLNSERWIFFFQASTGSALNLEKLWKKTRLLEMKHGILSAMSDMTLAQIKHPGTIKATQPNLENLEGLRHRRWIS